ncbi:MAG TPA: MBL fold metallo-hydrolase [Spirochaetales bacterium]|nr:MBL fold metallo-hydrolase [Spirochaetales bacterium]
MPQITKNVFAETKIRGCNPGYVVTSKGIVVIDTPQLPTYAIRMREECEKKGPIRYVINTEHHVDHIFGNYFFKKSAEHIVAHEETSKEFMVVYPQINPYEYAKEAIPTDDPEGKPLFPDEKTYFADPGRPDITITGDTTLRVGDHTFYLLCTPGHVAGQLAVYIPEERVVFVGDTIFNHCQTWLYTSNMEQWFRSLDRLLDLDVDYIVPGHGEVCNKQEIYVQRAFLLEWLTAVSNAIAKGWSKEECLAKISFLDRFPCDIGQEYMGPEVTKNNIIALYDFLTAKMQPMTENKR